MSVVPEFTKRPTEEYRVTISFACDPARTQDLVKALFVVVDDFKTNGPERRPGRGRAGGAAAGPRNRQPAERLSPEPAHVRLSVRRTDPGSRDARALYDGLTAPLLRDAARTYLDTNRYVKVVLFPEEVVGIAEIPGLRGARLGAKFGVRSGRSCRDPRPTQWQPASCGAQNGRPKREPDPNLTNLGTWQSWQFGNPFHPCLSATIGSTRVARSAGM